MKNLTLCTARYSDNLGDGLIAECIKNTLFKLGVEHLSELDIGGRMAYANNTTLEKKQRLRNVLYKLPRWLKPVFILAGWHTFMKNKMRTHYYDSLTPNSTLVLGGGQLLQDDFWHFPLKLNLLLTIASEKKCDVVFQGIGIGKRWSFVARILLRRSLKKVDITHLSVRDEISRTIWQRNFADICNLPIHLVPDAAISAASYYPQIKAYQNVIGLGVSHPEEIKNNATNKKLYDYTHLKVFWQRFYDTILADGYKPIFFTNGSEEDERFLQDVAEGRNILRRPHTPTELMANINSMSAVVAHRLHANIAAFALAKPAVGLAWDAKVHGFYKTIGLQQHCLSAKQFTVHYAYKMLQNSLQNPPRKQAVKQKVQSLEENIQLWLNEVQT